MIKRISTAAIGLAVVLGGAATAQARPDVDSGKYTGKTNKGTPVSFKVSKSKKLFRFKHRLVKMKCTDGDSFRLKKAFSSGPTRLTILDDGRFGFTVTYDTGGRWKVEGRIKGNKATGTLRVKLRFNSNDDPDPNGKIRCTSGLLHFKVKHRR